MPIDVKDAHGVTQSVPTLADIQPALNSILERLNPTPLAQGLTDAQLRAAALQILLPTGAASEAKQDAAIAAISQVLAKLISAPATEAKQDAEITAVGQVVSKLPADPATSAKQDTGNDSLASILAKLVAAPATEAKQDTGNTTLASLLAKFASNPSTAANQDTTNMILTGIMNKIIASPATAANQGTANATLASILAKLIAAPATEAKQDTGNQSLQDILSALGAQATEATLASAVTILNDIDDLMLLDGELLHETTVGASTSTAPVNCTLYEAIQIRMEGAVNPATTDVIVEGSHNGISWEQVVPVDSKGVLVDPVEPTASGINVWVIPEHRFYRVTITFNGDIVPVHVTFTGKTSAVLQASAEGQQAQIGIANEQRLRLVDIAATLELIRLLLAATLTVTGPLTNAELRAAPVPVTGSITVEPAPGAATSALQEACNNLLTILTSVYQQEDEPADSGALGMPMLAMRADADTPTAENGDWTVPKLDEEGRMKVATKPASIASVVGTANTVASTVVCDVRRASNVVLHVKNIGSVTLAAGTFVWEASIDSTNGTDGTWFSIQAVRSNANTIETTIALSGITAGSGYAASWEASVNGYHWMRIRCTVAVTASASAQWTIQRGSYATEPIPAAQASATQAISGSVTVTPATATPSNINSAASINAMTVKGSAGALFNITCSNLGAAAAYVKLYNKAAAPAPATDVPILVIPVPPSGFVPVQFGTIGHRFSLGIALVIVAGIADTDATAVAAAQVKVALSYI